MADVLSLDAYRRQRRDTIPSPPPGPGITVESLPGEVAVTISDGSTELRLWYAPDELRELIDLLRDALDDAESRGWPGG